VSKSLGTSHRTRQAPREYSSYPVSAQIASLKWSRPEYVERLKKLMGSTVDYQNKPSEDFARATIDYVDDQGHPLIVEATTSWSFVGAGLRLSMELLGPEYSMSINTLDSGLKLFFSREVKGAAGEDLVEKQNAEQGLMPVVANEEADYGYEGENRYFVNCFLEGSQPEESFYDGLEVSELLMTAYMSAEQGRVIEFRQGPRFVCTGGRARSVETMRYNRRGRRGPAGLCALYVCRLRLDSVG
jgi:predicted dehydrogenase